MHIQTRRSIALHNLDPLQPLDLPMFHATELELERRAIVRPALTAPFGPSKRLFPDPSLDTAQLLTPGFFASLPGRVDGGIDEQWGDRSHRVAVRCRRWFTDRRRVSLVQPFEGDEEAFDIPSFNPLVRSFGVGLLIELLAAGAIAAFVVLRKVY